jgi:hypothetical protein
VSIRLRLIAVLTGSVLATLGIAPPAFADSLSISDPARDMVGYCDGSGDCPAAGADPTRTDGDMHSTTITHSATNLMVQTSFNALSKPGKKSGAWTFLIQTYAKDGTRNFQLAAATGGTKDGHSTDGITFLINKGNDTLVSCSGRKTSIDYDADTIRVIIPRTCLKNPYRLRIGVLYYQRPTTADGLDGYRDKWTLSGYTDWIKHS